MNFRTITRKTIQSTGKLLAKLDNKLEPTAKQQLIDIINQLPPEVLVDTLKFIDERMADYEPNPEYYHHSLEINDA